MVAYTMVLSMDEETFNSMYSSLVVIFHCIPCIVMSQFARRTTDCKFVLVPRDLYLLRWRTLVSTPAVCHHTDKIVLSYTKAKEIQ